jgi:hypothetical protein
LFRTELTAVETEWDARPSDPEDVAGRMTASISSLSLLAGSSQSGQVSCAMTIGVLSWIRPISSVACVVMIDADQYQASSWSSGTSEFRHSS